MNISRQKTRSVDELVILFYIYSTQQFMGYVTSKYKRLYEEILPIDNTLKVWMV